MDALVQNHLSVAMYGVFDDRSINGCITMMDRFATILADPTIPANFKFQIILGCHAINNSPTPLNLYAVPELLEIGRNELLTLKNKIVLIKLIIDAHDYAAGPPDRIASLLSLASQISHFITIIVCGLRFPSYPDTEEIADSINSLVI